MDSPPRVEDSNLNDSGFGDHPLTISVTRNNPATRTRQDQGKRHREKRRNPVKYINPIYEVTELLHISMNSEQMTGLEPALQPWQGRVLPLTPHLHIPVPPTPAREEEVSQEQVTPENKNAAERPTSTTSHKTKQRATNARQLAQPVSKSTGFMTTGSPPYQRDGLYTRRPTH